MPTIFLDMDGVVADFDAHAAEIIGRMHAPNTRFLQEEWQKILNYPRFYRDLPLCKDAEYLVSNVLTMAQQNNMDVKFLSAIPRNNDLPWAAYDKVLWAQKYFPEIPVWVGPYSDDKQLRSHPGEVLIDDRKTNIKQWHAKGGFAILHSGDVKATLDQLTEFLNSR
jgi:hypothetical protein